MLNVTRREFERAYRAHLAKCVVVGGTSERLLLFYAIECGLKALLLQNRNVDDSTKLPSGFQIGHDLREGLKLTYAPAKLTVRDVRTRQNKVQQVTPRDLHEAFRYGVAVDPENDVTEDLVAVQEWLKGKIR